MAAHCTKYRRRLCGRLALAPDFVQCRRTSPTPGEGAVIRKAMRADIPRIFEIRHAVSENRLSHPDQVSVADCEWYIDNAAFWLWNEDGEVQGFSAADPRDGTIFALFVDPRNRPAPPQPRQRGLLRHAHRL